MALHDIIWFSISCEEPINAVKDIVSHGDGRERAGRMAQRAGAGRGEAKVQRGAAAQDTPTLDIAVPVVRCMLASENVEPENDDVNDRHDPIEHHREHEHHEHEHVMIEIEHAHIPLDRVHVQYELQSERYRGWQGGG